MRETIGAAGVVLYIWFMVFFIPGPEPWGMSVLKWGYAWLIPLLLLVMLTISAVTWRILSRG